MLGTMLRRVLPTRCAVCGAWPCHNGGTPWCAACHAQAVAKPPRCPRCALHLAQPHQPHACTRWLHASAAALDYAFAWRDLVLAFKTEPQLAWAPAWAQLMYQAALRAHLSLRQARWWLPIPMAATRLRQRGFNHAWVLAQALAQHTGGQSHLHPHLLQRTLDDQQQHRRSRRQRLAAATAWHVAQPEAVAGQRVVLIDDIMTTGATLDTAAHCLLEAGAAQVDALVLARAPLA
jgi:ComF family protein